VLGTVNITVDSAVGRTAGNGTDGAVGASGRAASERFFADDLARHGRRAAVVTAHGAVTYTELDTRVGELAARLGTRPRLVLIAVDRSLEAVVAYLAALRARHPVLLTSAGDDRAVQLLTAAYDPDVVLDARRGWALDERRSSPAHQLHPDLAVLLSTSGSTGSPKLVRLSRENLASNAAAIVRYLRLTDTDRAITTLPMQYCYGLSVVNTHLHAGAGLVLTDLSVMDRCFWDLFRASGSTSLAAVPHTFDLLDRVGFESMALPSLRCITQAGGRMDPAMVRRYAGLAERDGWELFVMYGQTEATARMAYLPPDLAASHPYAIGRPIPGGSLSIDTPDDDGVGELVYRGRNVMLGYAEHPRDLASGRTVHSLRTGDLARVDADGLYEIVGRRSRFIKAYGLRVDLDEVERSLAEHGFAALCTGDDAALVVAVEGADEDTDAAAGLVSDQLGLPRSYVRVLAVPALPRLPTGKPDHAAIARLAALVDPPAGAAPRVDVGEHDRGAVVRAAFSATLGVDATDDDTFVSLGGDSLSYVEMSIRLEQVLGTLPRDWHTTPIGDLVPARRAPRLVAATDTSAIVRAVAIVLIVGTHARLWQLPGGAHALLAVAGYNFARFQLSARTIAASTARIAVPSMCWIGLVAAASEKYGWPNALLVNGLVERPGDHRGYWFIEALVWTLVPLALLLAVPAVSRLDRARPLAVPAAALALGLLIRFDVVELTSTHRTSRAHEVLWLFALGWVAARADSFRQRMLVSGVATLAVPGFFENIDRELVILAGFLLVLWFPTMPVPRLAQRLLAPLAAASLYIYLTHFQVFPPLARLHGPAAAVVGSLVVGIVASATAGQVVGRAERAVRVRIGTGRADGP
jgi:acyl-CoA synthetase (AMP-forming)/AMP-acid ligase II